MTFANIQSRLDDLVEMARAAGGYDIWTQMPAPPDNVIGIRGTLRGVQFEYRGIVPAERPNEFQDAVINSFFESAERSIRGIDAARAKAGT